MTDCGEFNSGTHENDVNDIKFVKNISNYCTDVAERPVNNNNKMNGCQ